jgi:hypothetical protein
MSVSRSASRAGVWLIGARGSVATTVVAGCAAVTAGLHPPTGMVTETPEFAVPQSACRSSAASLAVVRGTARCRAP